MGGIVFDIQRNALHDGRGIRTTVFLKGCPFRCVWCSNPESQKMSPQLGHFKHLCTACGTCTSECQHHALQLQAGVLHIDRTQCVGCGACLEVCPNEAVKIYGSYMEADEVMAIVLKDKAYYDATGGGITLSGGDPLMQLDFAIEILQKAKSLHIHTTIESEGFYGSDRFSKILPYVDYLYFDYKITHPEAHKKYLGVPIDKVKESLDYAANYGIPISIRCIIVPGINDNEEHFKAIAALSNRYKHIEAVEVMSYHEYGINKYDAIGLTPHRTATGTLTRQEATAYVDKIISYGGKNISIG